MNFFSSISDTFSNQPVSAWSEIWLGVILLYKVSFVLVPLVLIWGTWKLWITWKQSDFIFKQKSILLEIRLPLDIVKPPMAMEIFITSLFQTGGESTWIDRLIRGKTRPWYSLELVSIEGKVKFFIWTRPAWKNHIEAQIYAQYPGVEVYEVQDYTLPVKHDPAKIVLWGCEFALTKSDPYPIKTYQNKDDYALLLIPGSSTEFQVDPISAVIEFLGSIGPGEQVWFQILIRSHKNDRPSVHRVWYNPFSWFAKADWKQALQQEITTIKAKEKDGKRSAVDDMTLKALELSTSKFPFETGIRAVYVAEKEHFNPITISGVTGSFRQYSSNNLNGFKPVRTTSFDYPWEDYKDYRLNSQKRSMLDMFKRRAYFLPPYKRRHFILNTEELATIYHFPSATVTTPGLARVPSKKGEPPANLPM